MPRRFPQEAMREGRGDGKIALEMIDMALPPQLVPSFSYRRYLKAKCKMMAIGQDEGGGGKTLGRKISVLHMYVTPPPFLPSSHGNSVT